MVRWAYLVAAIVVVAAAKSVGADERADARAPSWFWLYPAPIGSTPRPAAKEEGAKVPAWFWLGQGPKRKKVGPAAREKAARGGETSGPEWFWSSPASPRKGAGQGRQAIPEDAERTVSRLLFFSGIDLWRNAAFAHDGILWMPAGEGNEGFVLKALVSDGAYRYRAGALGNAEVTGWMFGAAVMPGVQFKRQSFTVALYGGIDFQTHRLSMFDPGNDLQGRHVGFRGAIDVWVEPTPRSMVTASATMSSIGSTYAARVAAGWRMLDRFYLGPEAIVFGGEDYSQVRIGLHMTGLKVRVFGWRFEWQGGLGYAVDDDRNRGPYARLGVLWRY